MREIGPAAGGAAPYLRAEKGVKVRVMTLRGVVGIGALLLFGGQLIAAEKPEALALPAAQAWLKLVDAGKYDASWKQSSKLFQGALSKAQWGQQLSGARKPLGKLVSRALKSARYAEKLPGAPDGKYVVIQFDTAFENKASAVETVTPMLDADGVWRVSGYFIR
jgi:hypothetical protein